MFFDKNKLRLAFSHSVKKEDRLFADIYGYGNIKKLFRMALESNHTCSILFTGPPASAKTLFLQSLMILKDSHFIDCSNATKSGLVDLLQANATIISGVLIFLILAPISKGIAALGYGKERLFWEPYAVLF
jgi:hypothetical protein